MSFRRPWVALAALLIAACGTHYEGGGRRRELPPAGDATSAEAGAPQVSLVDSTDSPSNGGGGSGGTIDSAGASASTESGGALNSAGAFAFGGRGGG